MNARADPFAVVIDANVLAGNLTRNIVLSLAMAVFFRPYWSQTILDELERYCARRTGSDEIGRRQRKRVEQAFPDALVVNIDDIGSGLSLPDPDDNHVLAAAIKSKAERIVTGNLRDFPASHLEKHNIEVITLDDFVADIIDLAGPEAIAVLRRMRLRFQRPHINAEDLLFKIEKLGMTETAGLLSAFRDLL